MYQLTLEKGTPLYKQHKAVCAVRRNTDEHGVKGEKPKPLPMLTVKVLMHSSEARVAHPKLTRVLLSRSLPWVHEDDL